MATNLSIDSNYIGAEAGEIMGRAFVEGNTLSRGLVDIISNVTNTVYLRKIDYANGIANYACGFNPSGDLDFNEVALTPKKLKNELQICKEDFRVVFDQYKMGYSAWNDNFKGLDESKAILTEVLADTADTTDYDIWNGTDTAGHFLGYLPQLGASGSTCIHITASVITEANVITEVKKVLAAQPVAVRKSKNLKFVVSANVGLAFQFAVSTYRVTNGNGAEDPFQLQFGSYKIDIVDNLPDNTMLIYDMKNLKLAMSESSDFNAIRIKDKDEDDFTGYIIMKMVWAIGTAIVRPEEVVLYN